MESHVLCEALLASTTSQCHQCRNSYYVTALALGSNSMTWDNLYF